MDRCTPAPRESPSKHPNDADNEDGGLVTDLSPARADRTAPGSGAARPKPFESVVADHGRSVLRVCLAVLGPNEADDAWSETFLSAMTAYPDLPGDANIEAWLVTIAHRKAIDATRAAARRPHPVDQLPETGTAPHAATVDPDLVSALAQLPPRQKQAVAYHHLAGLPYAEVAAIVGGSTDAARRAGADGIATLRRTYPPTDPSGVRAGTVRARTPRPRTAPPGGTPSSATTRPATGEAR